ncbi:MAG: ADP-ribosylglycohydrolase family protein [Eubacterium sp.]|nr:ADP-ribosylglycohydrolase family protein [Eubacterium sp.]
MLGAIIGDIVGSRYEWNNIKTKDFGLFADECEPTDDSIMSLAVAKAILDFDGDYEKLSADSVKYMREVGQNYPNCGYGGNFFFWIFSPETPKPYNSFGNGSAMRVSACGFAAGSLDEAKKLSEAVTRVSHNHPEGLKGAEAVAAAIYLARTGASISEIRGYINDNYYKLDFTLDEIREGYSFDVSCQGSTPQALEAFLESTSFEDAIRNAVSIGGDSDTIAAMAGGIAEAYYGIPALIREKAMYYLDERLTDIVCEFERKYPPKVI